MKKNKFILIILIIMTVVLLLTACRKDEDPEDEPYENGDSQVQDERPIEMETFTFTHEDFPNIDGSPVTSPLAQAVISVLLGETREDIAERTIFTRTTQAYRNLSLGYTDILIAGEPTPEVLDELANNNIEIEMAPIAMDALVFIVNAANPVENLTSEQLVDIYTGKITNWNQVGGENTDITAFQRNEEALSQVLMQKLVMDWQPMADAPIESFSMAFDMEEAITAIKGFDGSPGAIGYTMFYYADVMEMAEGFKILSVDSVKPGDDTIKTGEYPFLNPYYAVIHAAEPEDGPVRIMFNWLMTDIGQALISQEGYVAIKESAQSDLLFHTDMRFNVRTDDSKFTPFTTPHSMHSRLSNGFMSDFVPSASYGKVLPYSSAVTMNDGSMRISKYGLVTTAGLVVTDLVFDSITTAAYTTGLASEPRPAYHLRIGRPESDYLFSEGSLNAACALDGSWITSFEYVDIVFSDNVIFLMRERESFDIDVYNYSGQRLYNILELSWADEISEDTWSEMLVYGIGNGHGFVKLKDNTYAVMDVSTGQIRRADFDEAFMFSENLAAVIPNGEELWGFVNADLDIVIPPGYFYPTSFMNDRAVVETPDGRQHIIDKSGAVIFTVTPENFIIMNHDGNGFSVHLRSEWSIPTFYTNDLVEITYPVGATSLGPESILQYLGEGWYLCMTEEGTWLFTSYESYLLPQNRNLIDFIDGFIIYSEYSDDFTLTSLGVMLPDHVEVIYPTEIASLTPAVNNRKVTAFIMNVNMMHGLFINETYTQARYSIIDLNGEAIKTGPGFASYNEALDLFHVQGNDYFAWLDINGRTLVSIPLMSYSFD